MNLSTISMMLLVMAALTLSGCAPGVPPAPSEPVLDTGAADTQIIAPADVSSTDSSVKEVSIDLFNWGIDQEAPSIKKGDKVQIRVSSSEGTHGLMIPGLGLSTQKIDAGQEQVLEFTATQAGTFEYFCNVPCGSGHKSMRGELVIEP